VVEQMVGGGGADAVRARLTKPRSPEQLSHEADGFFVTANTAAPNEKDFGYVMTKEGGLIYFHRNSVLSGEFDKLRRGDEVTYVESMGDTGPTASKVRVLEKA
jgi:cold shock CspA family protein